MTRRTACATLVALLAGAPPAFATFPGENGRIVVQRPVGEQMDLFTVAPDGSGADRLRRTARIEEEPAWSPDGRRLAFALGPAGAFRAEVVTVDAAGGDLRRVTDFGSFTSTPAWAPAGDRLAFFTLKDFEDAEGLPPSELYSIGADGTGLRRLTRDRRVQLDPAFSPDGGTIAYSQWRPVKGRPGVFDTALVLSDADGSDPRPLTRFSARRDTFNASWSPDGQWIAFEVASGQPHGVRGGRQSDIALIRPDGSGEVRLTRTPAIETNPVWSPDGTSIAFTSDRHAASTSGERPNRHFELYVMGADGGDIRRLTRNGVADTHPDWQPLPPGAASAPDLRSEWPAAG